MSSLPRIRLLDIMKGIAIVLVVMGHAIQANNPSYKTDPVFNVIYSFHMPLFFVVSGYLMHFTLKPDRLSLLKARAGSLLYPHLVFNPIYYFTAALGFSNYAEAVKDMSFSEWMWESLMVNSGEWFLWTLFLVLCLLLLTNVVERHVRPAVFWLFLAGLVFIALFTPEMEKDYLRQTEIRYFLPFALAGYLIAKHRQALARSGWQLVYAGAVCYPVMMWLPGWEGGWERTYQHSFYWCLENGMAGFFWTRFLQALSGICLVLVFARVLNRLEAPARLLAKLGGVSLGVYLFHQIFSALAFGAGWVAALTGFASSLAIAVGLTIFCRKAGYLRIIVGDFRGVGKSRLVGELNVKPLA